MSGLRKTFRNNFSWWGPEIYHAINLMDCHPTIQLPVRMLTRRKNRLSFIDANRERFEILTSLQSAKAMEKQIRNMGCIIQEPS